MLSVPAHVLEDDAFWFFARLAFVPFEVRFGAGDEMNRMVDLADGSWARLEARDGLVVQGGARRLWDVIEDAHRVWCELGQPGRERFGLSAGRDGRQRAWLDDPGSPNTWDLLPA